MSETLSDLNKPINPLLDIGHIEDSLAATQGLLAAIATANQGGDRWRECETGTAIICGLIDDAIRWHKGKFRERAE